MQSIELWINRTLVGLPTLKRRLQRSVCAVHPHYLRINRVSNVLKYLSVCRDPNAFRAVIRTAPDSVIKSICNAALNIERGDIVLNSRQKACFRQFRKEIATLTSKGASLEGKRKLIQRQKGGFLGALPALLSTAISALGGGLFSR